MKRLPSIKPLLLYIACLNLLDGLFTYFGLVYHWIEEANPLLRSLPPEALLVIKIFLTGAVLGLWVLEFPKRGIRFWQIVLTIVAFLYTLITCLHITWLAFL